MKYAMRMGCGGLQSINDFHHVPILCVRFILAFGRLALNPEDVTSDRTGTKNGGATKCKRRISTELPSQACT